MPNNTLKDKAYLHLSTIKDAIVLSPEHAERLNLFHEFLGAKEAYINCNAISDDDAYVLSLNWSRAAQDIILQERGMDEPFRMPGEE